MNRRERRAIAATNEGWGPWEVGVIPPTSNEQLEAFSRVSGLPREEVLSLVENQRANEIVRINHVYQVNIRRNKPSDPAWPDIFHVSIKRRDRKPIGIEHFRDFQRIKNELIGEENEAVELYPAESRLADSANQYHLWIIADPNWRFPFGFKDRFVAGPETVKNTGAEQREF